MPERTNTELARCIHNIGLLRAELTPSEQEDWQNADLVKRLRNPFLTMMAGRPTNALADMAEAANDIERLRIRLAQIEFLRARPPLLLGEVDDMKLVTCDCSCANPCPQGKAGSEARCTVWKKTEAIEEQRAAPPVAPLPPAGSSKMDVLLAGMSVLIRSQYIPGKFGGETAKAHSAKLMDDIWCWLSDYAKAKGGEAP